MDGGIFIQDRLSPPIKFTLMIVESAWRYALLSRYSNPSKLLNWIIKVNDEEMIAT